MKIATRVIFDIETLRLLDWEGFDYEGPVAMAGRGPSQQQKDAATSQSNMDKQLSDTFGRQEAFTEAQQNKANPFYTNLLNNGLPYMNMMTDAASGNTARAFQPAKAQLEQSLGQSANALPSGFATQARSDLASNQAQAYDQQLQQAQGANLQAKEQGAAGIIGQGQAANPTAYSGQAISGNQSVMNAPLASPGLGGLLGGIAGGLASKIPF